MKETTRTWHQDSAFKAYNSDDWRSSVDQLLGGADFDKTLVRKTLDNIKISPLYPQQPDAPFYSRGKTEWGIKQTFNSGSLADSNKQILDALSEGLNSIELTLPTTKAANTLPCYCSADLNLLLTDVELQMISLSLTPGSANRLTGALLLSYYSQKNIAAEDVHCALNIDPLGTKALTGACAKKALADLDQFASHCDRYFPNASSICIDSSVYHNAGASEAQELACMIATFVEYLRALKSFDPKAACKQIRFRIALDSDYFLSIAKLRAARELIKTVARNCNADDFDPVIDAVGSTRTTSALDPSVNILRNGTQAAAAMAGGANSFNCTPYDQLTQPSEKAQRLARNTQHILIEESGLLKIDDPARGSGYVESLTGDLCKAAWTLFQDIEASGGMHQAIHNGYIGQQIDNVCRTRIDALNKGKTSVIGVTDYPDLHETASLDETPAQNSDADSIQPLATETNPENDSMTVTELIDALSAGKTTADYFSFGSSAITSDPIPQYRDSLVFELLRTRSNKHKENQGEPPTVILLTLGTGKDYSARVAFCKNFFAIAGIDTEIKPFDGELAGNTNLAVICSTDTLYLQESDNINSCNLDNLWIAGNNKDVLAKLAKSNINTSIHLRCDRLQLLTQALDLLGVPQ